MHYIIYKDKKGEFRWRLQASNGRIIADSGEGYTRKRNCRNAVESMITRIKNSSSIKIYE